MAEEQHKIIPAQKHFDIEYKYDDENEGNDVEIKAIQPPPKFNLNSYPTRSYLDKFVTPFLLEALKQLAKERPHDPIEFLAFFLMVNNPYVTKHEMEEGIGKQGGEGEEIHIPQ